MKNHEVVPAQLIASLAGLKHGNIHKNLSELIRLKLVSAEHGVHCTARPAPRGPRAHLPLAADPAG